MANCPYRKRYSQSSSSGTRNSYAISSNIEKDNSRRPVCPRSDQAVCQAKPDRRCSTKEYPTTFQTNRDLYNIKSSVNRELLQHTSTAQAMVSRLQELDFFVRYDSSDEGHLLAIFFVHPKMIKLWRRYPHVLLVDYYVYNE
jgi:hypothetical protein